MTTTQPVRRTPDVGGAHLMLFVVACTVTALCTVFSSQAVGHWLAPGTPVGIGISQRESLEIVKESRGFPSRLSDEEKAVIMRRYEGLGPTQLSDEMLAQDFDVAAYYGKAIETAYRRAPVVVLFFAMVAVAPFLRRVGYRPRDAGLLLVPILNFIVVKTWLWRIMDARWRRGQGEPEDTWKGFGLLLVALAIWFAVSVWAGSLDLVRVGR